MPIGRIRTALKGREKKLRELKINFDRDFYDGWGGMFAYDVTIYHQTFEEKFNEMKKKSEGEYDKRLRKYGLFLEELDAMHKLTQYPYTNVGTNIFNDLTFYSEDINIVLKQKNANYNLKMINENIAKILKASEHYTPFKEDKRIKEDYPLLEFLDSNSKIISYMKFFAYFQRNNVIRQIIKECENVYATFNKFLLKYGHKGLKKPLFRIEYKLIGEPSPRASFSRDTTEIILYYIRLNDTLKRFPQTLVHELSHVYEYSILNFPKLLKSMGTTNDDILFILREGFAIILTYYYSFKNGFDSSQLNEFGKTGSEEVDKMRRAYLDIFQKLFNEIRGSKEIEQIIKNPKLLVEKAMRIYLKYE